ncbi:MAG: extracellular solute-binding protein [Colwellia sp.]|nr:extracellular solute-binding protein [Colwellia sp.]
MIQNNIVLPINFKNIPNFKKISPSLQNLNYVTAHNLTYGIPIVYGIYGLAYNTNIVSQAPDSWEIFWQPQYKKNSNYSAGGGINQYSLRSGCVVLTPWGKDIDIFTPWSRALSQEISPES